MKISLTGTVIIQNWWKCSPDPPLSSSDKGLYLIEFVERLERCQGIDIEVLDLVPYLIQGRVIQLVD